MTSRLHKKAVVIGRFQGPHNGHFSLLHKALSIADHVVVVLGSAFKARDHKNPFTWEERATMIKHCLSLEDQSRITFVPMRDYYNDARWSSEVTLAVNQIGEIDAPVVLVGCFKDASSYYLDLFRKWTQVEVIQHEYFDATTIRKILFTAENIDISLSTLNAYTHSSVIQYIKAWTNLPYFAAISKEYKAIQKEKAKYACLEHPPIFSTVDSVVQVKNKILLIQRKSDLGDGLLALPGGFLEVNDRIYDGAVRELFEETNIAILKSSLKTAFCEVRVFDDPNRSLRGRTITHAHRFNLNIDHIPEIEGRSDARVALWVDIDQLVTMEEQFFEDHFHILDDFFLLT